MAELHVQASECSEAIYNPSCSHSSIPTSSVEMSFNFLITGPSLASKLMVPELPQLLNVLLQLLPERIALAGIVRLELLL